MKIGSLNIEFVNTEQILNMGGPWIGDLVINGIEIDNNIIIDNIISKLTLKTIFYIKYHDPSRWKIANYFTINSWNYEEEIMQESEEKYGMLYIENSINESEIIVFNSFHGEVKELGSIVDINTMIFNIRQL